MNSKVPIAAEFLLDFEQKHPRLLCCVSNEQDKNSFYSSAQGAQVTIDVMIEFAKLHVKAALKEASKVVTIDAFYEQYNNEGERVFDYNDNYEGSYKNSVERSGKMFIVCEDSILNAYPENKII